MFSLCSVFKCIFCKQNNPRYQRAHGRVIHNHSHLQIYAPSDSAVSPTLTYSAGEFVCEYIAKPVDLIHIHFSLKERLHTWGHEAELLFDRLHSGIDRQCRNC